MVFGSHKAASQTIYYNDGADWYVVPSSSEVTSGQDVLMLTWQPSADFAAPFTITHFNGTDTISHVELPVSYTLVRIAPGGTRVVSLRSVTGNERVVTIHGKASYAWLLWLAAMALPALVVYFVCRRHVRRSADDQPSAGMNGKTKKFECATVLFADIQGFTKIAEHMNPERLVDELDRYFVYIDELVEKYRVEKIKTIGDAYMCAGGVPDPDSANPIEVVLVGLGMISYVKDRRAVSEDFWNIRVGINTGPVISGLLGYKKKAFDIWGDSVNTASRMESSSVPGHINISGATYQRVRDYFDCEYRGKMPVKYKGEIDMYFVKGLKPEYAEAGSLYMPNALLMQKLRLLKLADLEKKISDTLLAPVHPLYVERFQRNLLRIEILGRSEKLDDVDFMLCKAVMMLSFAQMEMPKAYKTIIGDVSVFLRKILFTEEQIDKVFRLTARVCQGKKPETKVEEVVSDARNEIWCRKDIVKLLLDKHQCDLECGKRKSKRDYFRECVRQLNTVQYYTVAARSMIAVEPKEQVQILEQIIRQS